MPDWRLLAAEHLAGLPLPDLRREEVVQELSEHLEDEFVGLRERLPDDEARRRTLTLLAEPEVLIREIVRAEREDSMKTARIFFCGILTGAVAFLLGLLVFVFVLGETQFAAAVQAAAHPSYSPLSWLLHLVMGIWTIWLYSAIRPHYGPGLKTAAIAGFAFWLIAALVQTNWVSFHLAPIPLSALLAPLAAALPTTIVAVMAGAWPYELLEHRPSPALKAS